MRLFVSYALLLAEEFQYDGVNQGERVAALEAAEEPTSASPRAGAHRRVVKQRL